MKLLLALCSLQLITLIISPTTNAHEEIVAHQIHLLKPRSGSAGLLLPGLNCNSWQLAVETNNVQGWKTVPQQCEGYVGHYMLGAQYRKDCLQVTAAAHDFAKSINVTKDGKDVWIFDIDETSLSNLPYYAMPVIGFGAQPYNSTAFNEWQAQAKAPAIPSVLHLYQKLLKLGFKIVFLSGTPEAYREVKTRNMRNIGYHTWTKMILKQANETSLKATDYKSTKRAELVKMGYRIIGNIGDQWSDLLGPYPGMRTFKLPDPMYYIS